MRHFCISTAAVLLFVLCFGQAAGQLSKPHAHDRQTDTASNKFLQRLPTDDKHTNTWDPR